MAKLITKILKTDKLFDFLIERSFYGFYDDAIFLHNGQIYTCPHGVRDATWEAIGGIQDIFAL
jgi:hypothetical protein